MALRSAARTGSRCRPSPWAISAPVNGSPSISPRTLTSPRVPNSSGTSSSSTQVHAPGLSPLCSWASNAFTMTVQTIPRAQAHRTRAVCPATSGGPAAPSADVELRVVHAVRLPGPGSQGVERDRDEQAGIQPAEEPQRVADQLGTQGPREPREQRQGVAAVADLLRYQDGHPLLRCELITRFHGRVVTPFAQQHTGPVAAPGQGR